MSKLFIGLLLGLVVAVLCAMVLTIHMQNNTINRLQLKLDSRPIVEVRGSPIRLVSTTVVTQTQVETRTVFIKITATPAPNWVELSGPWVLTWYGDGDRLLGEKTGAAWNGLECKDYAALTTSMPDTVTSSHYGGAMPGTEFYCKPIKVCIADQCTVFTAVDVPEHDRLKLGNKYYNHVDLWPQVAEDLEVRGAGVVTQSVKVYVGGE